MDTPTADPEAMRLSPPVVVVDDPEPASELEPDGTDDAGETKAALAPEAVAQDPQTEVITFEGADAPPGLADQVTAPPKRPPSPSMLSGMKMAPNK
ncbi:MAG: hypothetical protein K0V04_13140 [Deltaproteobacteria bacterium]|nr:hypothetical protein [Deltaproteobacteria bacterium]